MSRTRPAAIAVVLAAALAGGCASTADPIAQGTAERLSERSCVRLPGPGPVAPGKTGREVVAPEPPRGEPRPVPGFSERVVATARDIGALETLERFVDLNRSAAGAAGIEAMRARQRLGDRVLLALLDVQGVVAELECERERGGRLAFVLAERADARDRRLTLSGIVSGAAGAIVSGGIGLAATAGRAADIVTIVSGGAEGGFGIAGLLGGYSADLRTRRNLLREVWEGPETSETYPAIVWRMLNAPVRDAENDSEDAGRSAGGEGGAGGARGGASGGAGRDAGREAGRGVGQEAGRDSGREAGRDAGRDAGREAGRDAGPNGGRDAGRDARRKAGGDARDDGKGEAYEGRRADGKPVRSVREALVEQWRRDGGLGEEGSEEWNRRTKLFFGEGGRFSQDDLQWRAALLDSLQAQVWLMSIELERLLREVIRPPDGPDR